MVRNSLVMRVVRDKSKIVYSRVFREIYNGVTAGYNYLELHHSGLSGGQNNPRCSSQTQIAVYIHSHIVFNQE